jgi:NNP family nitrate/nitrite transporter-like MFS transporter
MGVVSGIVGMAGGLGGFLLPIMFGIILDRLGVNSSCFMLLYGIVSVSLILSYLTEVRRAPVMGNATGMDHSRSAAIESRKGVAI